MDSRILSAGVRSIASATPSRAATDKEDKAGFIIPRHVLRPLAFVDLVRLAFAIPFTAGLACMDFDPLDMGLAMQPETPNFSRVPAETSWSILRVWRA